MAKFWLEHNEVKSDMDLSIFWLLSNGRDSPRFGERNSIAKENKF